MGLRYEDRFLPGFFSSAHGECRGDGAICLAGRGGQALKQRKCGMLKGTEGPTLIEQIVRCGQKRADVLGQMDQAQDRLGVVNGHAGLVDGGDQLRWRMQRRCVAHRL